MRLQTDAQLLALFCHKRMLGFPNTKIIIIMDYVDDRYLVISHKRESRTKSVSIIV